MKKLFTLLLFCSTVNSFSQTYPYAEGFEGMPSGQTPTGWTGSMNVLTYHGQVESKAVCARLSSATPVDSGITPLIGPLTGSSTVTFYYRALDFAFYPNGNAKDFDIGDQIELLLSTDGINYQTVLMIDMNNHNTSFNFVKKKVFITQWAGSNAYLKFRCQYGSGTSFYVDIDTFQVRNDPAASVEDLNKSIAP